MIQYIEQDLPAAVSLSLFVINFAQKCTEMHRKDPRAADDSLSCNRQDVHIKSVACAVRCTSLQEVHAVCPIPVSWSPEKCVNFDIVLIVDSLTT